MADNYQKRTREDIRLEAERNKRAEERKRKDDQYYQDYMRFLDSVEKKEGMSWRAYLIRENKKRKDLEAQKKINDEINKKKEEEENIEKAQLVASKKRIALEKTSRNISKDMTKLLDSRKGSLLDSMNIVKKSTQADAKAAREKTISQLRQNNLSEEEQKKYTDRISLLNATGDIQRDILNDFEAETLDNLETEEIRAKVLEKAGMTESQFKESNLKTQQLINAQIEKMKKGVDILNKDGFKEMYDTVGEIDDVLKPIIKKIKTFSGIAKESGLRLQAVRLGALAVGASLAKDVFQSAKDVRQELGLSIADSAKFGFQITRNAKLLGLLGGNAEEVKNFSVAIAKEFGNIGNLTDDVLKQFVDLSAATGLTGDNASKLANSIMSIQGGTLETSLNTIKIFENLARAEGVSSKLVLEDVAEDAELFATYAKEGGKNLAEAALQSRKLGIGLSTVSQMAEKLLEFESSIESQMEAQVILGRSLNLDKARELALMGNLEGLQSEVLKQVGSQAEFEAMLPLQRKALADAIGTSVADLGRMVRGERTSAQLAEDRAKAEVERGETQLQIMKSLETMSKITAGLAAIDQLRSVLGSKMLAKQFSLNALKKKGLVTSISQAIAESFKSGSMIPFLAGIPLAIGAIALLYNQLNKAKGFALGGRIDKDGVSPPKPTDTVPIMAQPDEIILNKAQQRNVANAIVAPIRNQPMQTNVSLDLGDMESKMDAQLKESKEMNQNTKKLLEQNQFLMTKLIRTTGGLKGDA